MTDQQLAMILLPLVVILPPAIGFLVGIRQKGRTSGAIAAVVTSVVVGLCTGVAWAAAIECRAALMPGGNPWIGHPQGVTVTSMFFGGALGGAASMLSGLLAACVVWLRR